MALGDAGVRIMSMRAVEPIGDHVTAAENERTSAHAGTVGLLQGSALYIASVLGSGILVLPSLSARAAGPASILAVLLMLILSIPLASTFAALAARHPDAGGVATFVRLALGKTAARIAGYLFYFGVSLGSPVVALLGASYIGSVIHAPREMVWLLGVAILVPPFTANMFGVRLSGAVQLVVTGVLVAIIVGVVAVSVPAVSASNFTPFMPHGWSGVGVAISLFVWAFAGWEAVTHLAGEFRNPRRTIPLATAVAITVVGLSYLALQFVTVGVRGSSAGSGAVPLVDLVSSSIPGIGPIVVAVIAGVVTVGVLNVYVGAIAKLGASLGRDRDLPKWMAQGAQPGGIARRSLLVSGVIAAIYFVVLIAIDMNFSAFILINTACMVVVYALGMVAAVRLLERWSLGWWMAVVSCVLVAGLLVLAGIHLFAAVILAVAAVAVTVVRKIHANLRMRRVGVVR